jgi:hypothetical protein
MCSGNSGYTGLLCSVCKPGFGQTDAFTCDACLGVSPDGQGAVNIPLIWALMVVYGAAFAAACSCHLDHNPVSCPGAIQP